MEAFKSNAMTVNQIDWVVNHQNSEKFLGKCRYHVIKYKFPKMTMGAIALYQKRLLSYKG